MDMKVERLNLVNGIWINKHLTHGGSPMKCVKNIVGEILRVSNKDAERMVDSGKAQYVKKEEWKKNSKKPE